MSDALDQIIDKIVSVIRSNSFKAHASLLETLISVIFHVEGMIEIHADRCIEVALELAKSEDSATKKVAIDAIYSLTAIIKDQIVPYRFNIMQILLPNRYHKVKPVREATLETIKLLKEVGPPIEEAELARLEDKPIKSARVAKSPIRSSVISTTPSAVDMVNRSKSFGRLESYTEDGRTSRVSKGDKTSRPQSRMVNQDTEHF